MELDNFSCRYYPTLQGNPIIKRRLAKIEKQSELYFTTRELAGILGVERHTLFYYDEMGPFSPAIKKGNGYRYCFVWQMDTFEAIHVLQRLGVSLGEIEEYMENRSPKRFTSMVDGKKRQIDGKIRHLKNMKRFILHEEESVRLTMNTVLDELRLVERGREYLLMSDISAGLERKATVGITEHVRMQERYNGAAGAVGSTYLGEDLEHGIYDCYVKVYTGLDKKTISHRVQNRPERTYVELYNGGRLQNMEKSYRLIAAFTGERGIRLGKVWYENLILDELTVKAYEQYIVKVMVPIGNPQIDDSGYTGIYSYVGKRLDKSTFGQVLSREDMEGDVYKRARESFQRLREVSDIQDRKGLRYGELYMSLPKEWSPGKAGQLNSGIPEEEYRPIHLITSLRRRRPPWTRPEGVPYVF